MIGFIPISDEDSEISGRFGKGHRNQRPTVNSDSAVSTGCLMEVRGRKVEVASDLILHLQGIGVVLTRWDRTRSSEDSILIRVLPQLHPVPVIIRKIYTKNKYLKKSFLIHLRI